jgi:hypothetical protein
MIRQISMAFGLASITTVAGCHQPAQTAPAAVAADSLKGIVAITGTSFEQRLILRNGNGVTSLAAVSPESAALVRMGGIEVLVVGNRTPAAFEVDHFTAINVAGAPVADGVLRNDDGRLVLETTRGRVALGNPPTALRGMIGARVWIGGPLDKGPNSYGVIAPAR